MPTMTGVEFFKKQTEQVYGRRYSQILGRNGYVAFWKLPEAPYSSAPTVVFLNPLTVEKPGNLSLSEVWE